MVSMSTIHIVSTQFGTDWAVECSACGPLGISATPDEFGNLHVQGHAA